MGFRLGNGGYPNGISFGNGGDIPEGYPYGGNDEIHRCLIRKNATFEYVCTIGIIPVADPCQLSI